MAPFPKSAYPPHEEGYTFEVVKKPPSIAQLEPKSKAAKALINEWISFNWGDELGGWLPGRIVSLADNDFDAFPENFNGVLCAF